MSVKSWIEEFVPVSVEEQVRLWAEREITAKDLVKYGLQKWEGWKPENLAKHGVINYLAEVRGAQEESLNFPMQSCGLCEVFKTGVICKACIGTLANGFACDEDDSGLVVDPGAIPWYTAVDPSPNLEPMFAWLNKTLEHLEEQENENVT